MSTATVDVYGFPMVCEYDYEPEERAILWGDYPHPGSPENACLTSCKVGGVEIYNMLSSKQIDRIEEALLESRGDERDYWIAQERDARRDERLTSNL